MGELTDAGQRVARLQLPAPDQKDELRNQLLSDRDVALAADADAHCPALTTEL